MPYDILIELFPLAFNLQRPQPLALGIHEQILSLPKNARGDLEEEALRHALTCYCRRHKYLAATRAGVPRINLDGSVAGDVSPNEQRYADNIITYRARRNAKRKEPAPVEAPLTKPSPFGSTLTLKGGDAHD